MQKMNSLARLAQASVLLMGVGYLGSAQAGILEEVQARDTLRCGVSSDKAGFSYLTDDGQWTGMDVDLCRAVAAAVLGDADKVEYVVTTAKNRFTALASGGIDVLHGDQRPGGRLAGSDAARGGLRAAAHARFQLRRQRH